jgi:SAM-dependent methyltransferase
MQLEYTACPLCATDKPNQNKQFIFEPFRVVQCTACQLWYLSPRLREPEMLKAYASPDYFKGGGDFGYSQQQGSYLDKEIALRLTFRKFIRQLKRRGMTGGHLLEVGCGYGFLLEEAAPLFESLTGTDFDSEAVKCVKQLGFQALGGGVEAVPSAARYDLILATGVIEHVYKPIQFVKQLRQHLSATGWIVLATPPMNSFWLKLQGKNWPSFKIPEHVTYYDRHTLTELFRRCGATQTIRLAYPQAYPLGMIGEKLGFSIPASLAKYSLWLPATMFAMAACFNTAESKG